MVKKIVMGPPNICGITRPFIACLLVVLLALPGSFALGIDVYSNPMMSDPLALDTVEPEVRSALLRAFWEAKYSSQLAGLRTVQVKGKLQRLDHFHSTNPA
jgi:hypothetical protein